MLRNRIRPHQPKRERSDADTGDGHEILAEVDNWDLTDHLRKGTHVQNRLNVQVGSRDNQQKTRPGKDGFLVDQDARSHGARQ